MSRFTSMACVLGLALAVGGCQTVGNPFDGFGRSSSKPTPLAPVPTQPVTATDLPPPEMPPQDPNAAGLPAAGEQQVAALPPATDITLEREDLIGGWKISSGGANCQLFLTLTGWTGGYRATTRGCPDSEVGKIAAWDLNGQQVVLKGDGGAEVARLYPTGAERFAGQTAGAQAVSVYR